MTDLCLWTFKRILILPCVLIWIRIKIIYECEDIQLILSLQSKSELSFYLELFWEMKNYIYMSNEYTADSEAIKADLRSVWVCVPDWLFEKV